MENLEKILRDKAYDLIEGPIRNHQPLQLWLKRNIDRVDIYQSHIKHAFSSKVQIKKNETAALSVDSTQTMEYSLNIGLTVLDKILKSLGMGALELSSKITKGKTLTISYDNSVCMEYMAADIESFLASADFVHPNPSLMDNLNDNDVLVINGVLAAKNLKVKIETELASDNQLKLELQKVANANLVFTYSGSSTIIMNAVPNIPMPIAVKAYRLQFNKGRFVDIKLITDTRRFF